MPPRRQTKPIPPDVDDLRAASSWREAGSGRDRALRSIPGRRDRARAPHRRPGRRRGRVHLRRGAGRRRKGRTAVRRRRSHRFARPETGLAGPRAGPQRRQRHTASPAPRVAPAADSSDPAAHRDPRHPRDPTTFAGPASASQSRISPGSTSPGRTHLALLLRRQPRLLLNPQRRPRLFLLRHRRTQRHAIRRRPPQRHGFAAVHRGIADFAGAAPTTRGGGARGASGRR